VAVVFGQFVFIYNIDHDFEQGAYGAQLGWGKQIEQCVSLLTVGLDIEGHLLLSFRRVPCEARMAACPAPRLFLKNGGAKTKRRENSRH